MSTMDRIYHEHIAEMEEREQLALVFRILEGLRRGTDDSRVPWTDEEKAQLDLAIRIMHEDADLLSRLA